MSVYFGGSRHSANWPLIERVCLSVIASGQSVHVGCQHGADNAVRQSLRWVAPSSLVVFAVESKSSASSHLSALAGEGVQVHFSAGGQSAPMPARFLLRSLAGLAGCSVAVFFSPGAGSLAVASHAVNQGIPVFAFASSAPLPPRGCAGQWVASQFMGFACWQWSPAQLSLF